MPSLKLQNATTAPALVRRETFDGRNYLVAPVVAVVETVLHRRLLPASEIERSLPSWNGRPVPIMHAYDDQGNPVSVNSPESWQSQVVGTFFNAQFDGQRLRGELWIDIDKARSKGEAGMQTLAMLDSRQQLEVSTAFFSDIEAGMGTFNGQQYDGIHRNILPDHLAVLPGGVGECSWDDGCGAPRINAGGGGDYLPDTGQPKTMWQRLLGVVTNAAQKEAPTMHVQQGDLSFSDIAQILETAMIDATGDPMRFLIKDIYDTFFVYFRANAPMPPEGEFTGFDRSRCFRRTYAIDDNQRVTLGEPEEVVREVTYVPVTNSTGPQAANPTGGDPMSQEQTKTVTTTNANANATQTAKQDPQQTATQGVTQGADPNATANAQQTQQAPANQSTLEQRMEALEKDNKELRQHLEAQDAERKDTLIKRINANNRNTFTDEDLKAMSADQLAKYEQAIRPADYRGIGGPMPFAQSNGDDLPKYDKTGVVMKPITAANAVNGTVANTDNEKAGDK